MCAWAPTARADTTFRRVFPHVLEVDAEEVHILVGSRQPLPLERERWRANLRAAEGYLGAARAQELARHIEECRTPPASEPQGEINEDLFPRDEFASPWGLTGGG